MTENSSKGSGAPDDWIDAWIQAQREQLNAHVFAANSADPLQAPLQLMAQWMRQWDQIASTAIGAAAGVSDANAARAIPPLGWAREHHELWRALGDAQAKYEQASVEYTKLLQRIQSDALDLLHAKVRERTQTQPVASARELYDLWIECGEQAFARTAHDEEFARRQADATNASSELRVVRQKVIELVCKHYDLPTRAEMNSLNQQIRDLRAELERMREPHPKKGSRAARSPVAAGLRRRARPRKSS